MNLIKFLTLTATFFSSNILFSAVEKTPIVPTLSKPTAKTVSQSKNIPSEHVKAAIDTAPKTVPAAKTMTSTTSVNTHTAPVRSTAKPNVAISKNNGSSHVIVPYLKELQNAQMSPAIIAGWQELYEKFLQANDANSSATADSSAVIPGLIQDPANLKTLLTTNFFNLMAAYLNPATFPKLANDPDSQIHFNYTTTHLRDATIRLGSISSITDVSGTPTVQFKGDCRDMGIIVNIQNNTDAQFSINQTSLDGTKTIQIGQLNPGLNEVNLHTAALQTSADATKSTIATTSNYFEIVENGTENNWLISIKLMTGSELLASLEPISSTKPDIFLMNGEPTAARYIAKPNNVYLVLTNLPTSINTNTQMNKRIQALDITEFSGPFLMTLQINPINDTTSQTNSTEPTIINQPSMISVQIINPLLTPNKKTNLKFNLPLFIIPEFLWKTPTNTPSTLQAYWMIIHTIYLKALSSTLINKNNFGNSFEYFKTLECFDENKACRIVIDLFSILESGKTLFDAQWIIGSSVYEASKKIIFDIDQINSSQNAEDKIIANSQDAAIINCTCQINNNFFKKKNLNSNFNNLYQIPYEQFHLFTIPNLNNLNKFIVFADLKKIDDNKTLFTITNKKNTILFKKTLYNITSFNSIEINFITNNKKWSGSTLEFNKDIESSPSKKFEIQYQKLNKQFSLKALPFIRKNKKTFQHVIEFTKQPPIENLYIEAYEKRNISSYATYNLIKNNNSPSFLQKLTLADWMNGISLISVIKNDKETKSQKNLIIKFYKEKKYLGELTFKNIKKSIKAYNLKSSNFDPAFDIYLTTEIILKYKLSH
ncbi:hypothetical protein KBB68_03370 [Candidatus Babeliales bacterium]|nr:hypothetical protein [Candidatus Babeliales bacterium]